MEPNTNLKNRIVYNQQLIKNLSDDELVDLETEIYGESSEKDKIVSELGSLLTLNKSCSNYFISDDFNKLSMDDKKIIILLFEVYFNVDFGFYSCINKITDEHINHFNNMIYKYKVCEIEKKRGL